MMLQVPNGPSESSKWRQMLFIIILGISPVTFRTPWVVNDKKKLFWLKQEKGMSWFMYLKVQGYGWLLGLFNPNMRPSFSASLDSVLFQAHPHWASPPVAQQEGTKLISPLSTTQFRGRQTRSLSWKFQQMSSWFSLAVIGLHHHAWINHCGWEMANCLLA